MNSKSVSSVRRELLMCLRALCLTALLTKGVSVDGVVFSICTERTPAPFASLTLTCLTNHAFLNLIVVSIAVSVPASQDASI
jgi:hypothetical protein